MKQILMITLVAIQVLLLIFEVVVVWYSVNRQTYYKKWDTCEVSTNIVFSTMAIAVFLNLIALFMH